MIHRVNKELDNRSWLEKMALPILLIAAGALYMFGAMHNGMANSYYAAAVKRQFGFASAMISAVTLMLTPVAALMFGFNNPDAILTFMLTASGYAFLRSLEGRRPLLWLGLAGLFTGLAFNTKMLQGLMVLPAMVIVYLAFAKPPIVTRFLHLMFAGVITTVSTL